MKRIFEFFRPGIINPIPSGIIADDTAMGGLYGLWQAANKYSSSMTSATTAGTDITLTAAQLNAGVLQLNVGASGGFTITTPSGNAINADLGSVVNNDGSFSKQIDIVNNNVGQTGTLTGGSGVTVVGTASIATNTKRSFILRSLNTASISITNIGSLSL